MILRNFLLRFFSLILLITSTTQPAGADVFVARREVARIDAFRHVTGIREADLNAANLARILRRNADGEYWVENLTNGRQFFAGKFVTATIQTLRQAVEARERRAPQGRRGRRAHNGTFNVIAGFHPSQLTPAQQRRCNVTAMQANPANLSAVFQVASNFDCLEGAGPMLTDWTHARAQGELAAVSALPGSILRRYGIRNIDLLSNLPHPAFRLRGAGVNKHLDFRRTLPGNIAAAAAFDESLVKVGIHLNTDVTFGLVRAGARGAIVNHTSCFYGDVGNEDEHDTPNIIQIYTSALNLQLNAARNFAPASYAHIETIAKKMLRASYEGTLLASAIYGPMPENNEPQEVFLTLMGCGVFNNKLEWVAETLEDLQELIERLNLKVTLLVFDGSSAGMDEFLPRMQDLVEATGGEYEEIHPA